MVRQIDFVRSLAENGFVQVMLSQLHSQVHYQVSHQFGQTIQRIMEGVQTKRVLRF
ncbi:MAG: hypothetical protein NC826_04975 [Candidatus Omnitrophica bacterium]|nr:hypothetical protein [Candidatus Omnitrophota bacterium]